MRGKPWVVFATLAAAIVLPLYAVKVYKKDDYTDFQVYYRAATRSAAAQWSEVYTLADGAAPFRYAPPLLPLLRPLAELEPRAARTSWYFLQCLWVAIAVWALYRVARLAGGRRSRLSAAAAASIGFLFVLRFCLDCFTIGQVTTVMWAGYALALLAWTARRPGWAGAGLFVPAALKIGPGVSYLPLLLSPASRPGSGSAWKRLAPVASAAAIFAALNLGLLAWLGSAELFSTLWRGWAHIVANDANYFDAAHYGSQSLKSALLRLADWTGTDRAWANAASALLTVAGLAGLALFWSLRRARSFRGRALLLSTTVFPYLWFMPETFKYSLIPLALPVTLLVTGRRGPGRFTLFTLAFGAATLSLAGLDIVGETLFFGMQRASVPFLATLLLGIATFREAWRSSRPSELGRFVAALARAPGLGPWRRLPDHPSLDLSVLIPLPLSSLVALSPRTVSRAISSARRTLEELGIPHEILVVPYGNRASPEHPALRAVSDSGGARVVWPRSHGPAEGTEDLRGAALREGFLESRGRRLASLQVEQPCDPVFLVDAWRALDSGALLARGNRRHADSRFRVPVRLLPLVYGRHRLGLRFNQLVRLLLPSLPACSTDTQSGTWMIERSLASHAFAAQASPDFLFEIELGLACAALDGRPGAEVALPVRLEVAEEKRKSRMLGETLEILRGLPRLARRYRQGLYSPERPGASAITADDWGLSPGVNAGILALAREGVVRRVSVMATLPQAGHELAELARVPGVEIGLHFNLTHGRFASGQSLLRHSGPGGLLLRWLKSSRAERARIVQAELSRQLDELERLGVRASYVDGHQHTHLLPGMLDAIAPELKRRGISVVRIPYDRSLWLSAKAPILMLALLGRRAARRHGFASRPVFYPQPEHVRDPARLRARLRREPDAEVITHPAAFNDLEDPSLEFRDTYTSERIAEFQSLRMLGSETQL